MNTPLYTIVTHFGDPRQTLRCINSLIRNIEGIRIVLVNNGPNPEFPYLYRSGLKIINCPKNLGFAGGNNIGIKFCLENKAESIFLLNNDALAGQESIPKLLKALWSEPQIGIVGPKIITTTGEIWFAGGYLDKKRYTAGHYGYDEYRAKSENNEVDFISGCAMLVKSVVFQKIGSFDERFFLYYEDVDFCMRAKKLGFKLKYAPDCIAYHAIGTDKNPISEYYQERNHFLFTEKHAPLKIKIREFFRFPKTIYGILNGNKETRNYKLTGIKDYILRKFGEYDYRD